MIIRGVKKLAKELSIGESTIHRWCNIKPIEKALPRKRVEDQYRVTYLYDLDVVKQWIKDNNRLLKNTRAKL